MVTLIHGDSSCSVAVDVDDAIAKDFIDGWRDYTKCVRLYNAMSEQSVDLQDPIYTPMVLCGAYAEEAQFQMGLAFVNMRAEPDHPELPAIVKRNAIRTAAYAHAAWLAAGGVWWEEPFDELEAASIPTYLRG